MNVSPLRPAAFRRRAGAPAALIAAAALVLAGCGGAANTPADGPGDTSPAASQSAGPGQTDAAESTGAQAAGLADLTRAQADDPRAVGDPDAPSTVLLFTDPSCPYCAHFHAEVLPKLVSDYAEAGKVRLEVHDLGVLGTQSVQMSAAARAAAEQGRYFEYLEPVYAATAAGGKPGQVEEEQLLAWGEQAGLPDQEAFRAAVADQEHFAEVRADSQAAADAGLKVVPTVLVDGEQVDGVEDPEAFFTALDARLDG